MSFDLTDTAGIKALLDNLRSSSAWAEALSAPTGVPNNSTVRTAQSSEDTPKVNDSSDVQSVDSSANQSSVAALLLQLRDPLPTVASPIHNHNLHDSRTLHKASVQVPIEPSLVASPRVHTPFHQTDYRSLPFQQSLSHVAKLAEDKNFAQNIKRIKVEQDELEQKLWAERQDIIRRHDEKVNAAKAKAQIIGDGGLTKHDAEMLSSSVRRELLRFDLERALPAWDGLVAKHQAAMEAQTVPAMFVSSDPADLKKQKKIMQLLEDVAFGEN